MVLKKGRPEAQSVQYPLRRFWRSANFALCCSLAELPGMCWSARLLVGPTFNFVTRTPWPD